MINQNCLSPAKQNQSPRKVALRNAGALSELLDLVKASGLKLPSHIEKSLLQDFHEAQPLLKMVPIAEASKQNETLRKIKVKLGDTEFELKKIQQDFAQYKLNSRLEIEKEIKKWEEAYNNLKSNLDSSNQDSSAMFSKLKEVSDKQIQNLKAKHDAEIKQQKEKLTKKYQQKLQSAKKVSEREINQLSKVKDEQIFRLKAFHDNQMKLLKENQQSELKKISLRHKEMIDQKDKQYQGMYTALQSEKKTEEKLHEKTKIQASQAKQKLYSDLYYERNVKKDLESTLQKKQLEIKALKIKIHNLEIDIIIEKQKAEKKYNEIRKQYENQKIGIQQLNKEHLADVLSSHQKELQTFQKSIQQMKQWKQNQESLMMERYDEIEAKFQQRPSRKEDLQMIEKLKIKIMRRQQEIRLLNRELKNCVLESQNKEQSYNKIFASSTVNKLQKRTLSKDKDDFKSKDSLCRKSQTTDIKFLMKVYNKHI